MNQPYSSPDWTSATLEKTALNRFRVLVNCLPKDCRVFREPWDCSTVLCLDFAGCPAFLEEIKGQEYLLLAVAEELGLAKGIIYRIGNKFLGWSGMTPAK